MSAARSGANAYSKGLAAQLGPHGVRVNVAVPGFYPTSGFEAVAAERSADPGVLAASMAESIPLRRPGDPAEFAQLVVFLVSPAASYLTGSQFAADGGAMPTL